MVMAGGQPVTDADVSLEFFMPAMPAMKMAEMRNSVPLKHEGAGRYRGAGNVMMAGSWDVTVSVKRNGQEIGSHKLEVAAN
jgi:Cu(I)/Ag(I) efflux system membrane fusion protein/cobalt-zinc-cadmium efflux system membrane fusion protein